MLRVDADRVPGGEGAFEESKRERVSRAESGLSGESLEAMAKLTEPTEVMVFATPT